MRVVLPLIGVCVCVRALCEPCGRSPGVKARDTSDGMCSKERDPFPRPEPEHALKVIAHVLEGGAQPLALGHRVLEAHNAKAFRVNLGEGYFVKIVSHRIIFKVDWMCAPTLSLPCMCTGPTRPGCC